MRNHLFFGKENCHNLWNMITNDVIYKDKRGYIWEINSKRKTVETETFDVDAQVT